MGITALVILLVVIVVLLCEPQHERGAVLGRLVFWGAIALAIYAVMPIILAFFGIGAAWVWETHGLQKLGAAIWLPVQWVFGAVAFLTIIAGGLILIRDAKAEFIRRISENRFYLFRAVGRIIVGTASILTSAFAIVGLVSRIAGLPDGSGWRTVLLTLLSMALWLVWLKLRFNAGSQPESAGYTGQ